MNVSIARYPRLLAADACPYGGIHRVGRRAHGDGFGDGPGTRFQRPVGAGILGLSSASFSHRSPKNSGALRVALEGGTALYLVRRAHGVAHHDCGFWRYLVPNVATFPRSENFEFLDAINPNLWPHGPNLTEGILTQPTVSGIETEGSIRWESLSLSDGRIEQAPVIEQAGESDNSRLLVRLPAGQGRRAP